MDLSLHFIVWCHYLQVSIDNSLVISINRVILSCLPEGLKAISMQLHLLKYLSRSVISSCIGIQKRSDSYLDLLSGACVLVSC